MDKRLKVYITLLVLVVLAIFYIESIKERPINWFPSYNAKHKIPYGTYVLREEIPTLFKKGVRDIYQPPYTFLQDITHNGTYFFVDESLNFGEAEFATLMEFVERGNDVFMATNGAFIDTLNIQTKQEYSELFNEQIAVRLVNPVFNNTTYSFDRDFGRHVFTKIDTLKTTVLGELIIRNQQDSIITKCPNFIKVNHGKGHLFIHTFPEAFTNYNMLLDTNYHYVASVLSYLNKETPLYWDAYYKTGKSSITSPMHYIISSKHLKWTYYTALIGILLFILFKGKRKQRSIPIVVPLKNQSLAFTQTIASLYYEQRNHHQIATHKINYFLEYIRTQYRLPTHNIDEAFYTTLASRSGNTVEVVKQVFQKILMIQQQPAISKEELIELNTAIEQFKNDTNNE